VDASGVPNHARSLALMGRWRESGELPGGTSGQESASLGWGEWDTRPSLPELPVQGGSWTQPFQGGEEGKDQRAL
jgi:hypothetical protein